SGRGAPIAASNECARSVLPGVLRHVLRQGPCKCRAASSGAIHNAPAPGRFASSSAGLPTSDRRVNLSYSIKTARGAPENRRALRWADWPQGFVQGEVNLLVAAGKLAHRPVGAEHAALGTEILQGRLDVGLEVRSRPGPP